MYKDDITEKQFLDIHKRDLISKRIKVDIYNFIAIRDIYGNLRCLYYIYKEYGTELYSKTHPDYYEKVLGKDWEQKINQAFNSETS